MELSKRLQAVANMITEGLIVADVGTDHGYIPIYLIQTGKCRRAFAMDVNKGPLLRAREHIEQYYLAERIEIRLSDGVKALAIGECDCVVMAGMGGALTIKIMEEGKTIFCNLKEFVLQPQSEIAKVRQYLSENGYAVVEEDMVLEDGKFYPMMKVINGKVLPYDNVELLYGKGLLQQKHPILQQFLQKELRSKENILEKLNAENGECVETRKNELEEEVKLVKEALNVYL